MDKDTLRPGYSYYGTGDLKWQCKQIYDACYSENDDEHIREWVYTSYILKYKEYEIHLDVDTEYAIYCEYKNGIPSDNETITYKESLRILHNTENFLMEKFL